MGVYLESLYNVGTPTSPLVSDYIFVQLKPNDDLS